jgi:2-polyprenyl-3-methyl-5-hydroxy-6-metoxy-1,4-benzoquinol methylase
MQGCPICHSKEFKFGSIGRSIISGYVCSEKEDSLNQSIYDIQLNLCTKCSTLFQKKYKSAEIILKKMYTQHEATMRSSVQYAAYYDIFASKVVESLNQNSGRANILEIGCNDGQLLSVIGLKCDSELYGFEPSVNFKDIWKQRKINGINDFFGAKSAKELRQKSGAMNLVIARHVLEHIENPHDFFEGLRQISNDGTTIFIEVPYLASIFQLNRFENVSYSHLVHYSVRSMVTLAEQFGFIVADFNLCDVDGGSIVFKIMHQNAKNISKVELPTIEAEMEVLFEKFLSDFRASKSDLVGYFAQNKSEKFIGFGAGAKGQFLIHLYGLEKFLTVVIDETPGYAGKFIPGTDVSIVGLDYIDEVELATVVNLAPTHTQAVMNKIPEKVKFMDPVNNIYPTLA